MLLTITTTQEPATDLGFLLHKNPSNVRAVDLAFGRAHVFYPEADAGRCSASMLLEVDPIRLVRRGRAGGLKEPLYGIHECVFGILALESEPIDPRS